MSTSPNDPNPPTEAFEAALRACRTAMRSPDRSPAIDQLRSQLEHDDPLREACEKLLHQHFDQLEQAAYRDRLTGLFNRRYFEDQLAHQQDLLTRYDIPYAIGLIDLDHFKQVNDRQGHAAGDRTLVDTACQLSGTIRVSDVLTRYGGDEFALLVPHAEAQQLPLFLDRLRSLGRAHHAFSMGWVLVDKPTAKADEIVAKADQALYEAKRAGCHAWRILPLDTEP